MSECRPSVDNSHSWHTYSITRPLKHDTVRYHCTYLGEFTGRVGKHVNLMHTFSTFTLIKYTASSSSRIINSEGMIQHVNRST